VHDGLVVPLFRLSSKNHGLLLKVWDLGNPVLMFPSMEICVFPLHRLTYVGFFLWIPQFPFKGVRVMVRLELSWINFLQTVDSVMNACYLPFCLLFFFQSCFGGGTCFSHPFLTYASAQQGFNSFFGPLNFDFFPFPPVALDCPLLVRNCWVFFSLLFSIVGCVV